MDNLLWLDSTSTMPRCDPQSNNDLWKHNKPWQGMDPIFYFLSKLLLKDGSWVLTPGQICIEEKSLGTIVTVFLTVVLK